MEGTGRWVVRSLAFHWKSSLAVIAGCFIASAALTGALLVGDSMRGSLRAMTLERLGAIDLALVGDRFFRQDLPARLLQQPGMADHFAQAAGIVMVRGSVTGPSDSFASGVNLIGTTPEFWSMFNVANPAERAKQVVLNQTLADELKVKAGARIVARVASASPIPREGLLGRRDEVILNMPVEVAAVIPTAGVGRFSLDNSQRLPLNLFVPIEKLADLIEQQGRANALFLSAKTVGARESTAAAEKALAATLSLDDYGLRLLPSEKAGYIVAEDRRLILDDRLYGKIAEVAKKESAANQPVLSYLVNTIAVGKKEVPYSIVTALDPAAAPPLGPLPIAPALAALKPDEIVLNQWTVDQLGAKVGDEVRLDYFRVDDRGELLTDSATLRLAGIVAMNGLALGRDYTPEYPGITDADNFGDWNAPFPVDLKRVRKVDEDYWDDYRTAPKGFVARETGLKLWKTRFGGATSIRLAAANGQTPQVFATKFGDSLLHSLNPDDVGFSFLPVKTLDLSASLGSTDFGQLFLAFSFFLILAAALLVGLLLRLNAERRSREIGLLLAVGIPVRKARRLLLVEGVALAAIGALAGLAGAVVYAKAMIAALTSWWVAAVNLPFIQYHATPTSFVVGFIVCVIIAAIAVRWAIGLIVKTPPPRLLQSGFSLESVGRQRTPWRSLAIGIPALLGGAALAATSRLDNVGAFFGGGFLLLIGGIAFYSTWLRMMAGGLSETGGVKNIVHLGIHNGGRHPTRTLLTVSLIAMATFIIVAVGTMRHGDAGGKPTKNSGDGGFALVGETSAPIYRNLADPGARFSLNISDATEKLLDRSTIYSFRVRAGDDASCLNVYQPRNPTLFGAGSQFIQRGGFSFAQSLASTPEETANPWLLLDRTEADDVVPVIGDMNTLMWSLKIPVGGELKVRDELGRPLRLRIAGSLAGSILQGVLVMSESQFLRHFPNQTGFRYFLIELPEGELPSQANVATRLEKDLFDYGMDVSTSSDRLADFKAVENTYMAAFQSLGGLGLLVGTLGLAAVLLRNVLERRGELALLRAVGLRTEQLVQLVLAENLSLLAAGLGIGTATAIVAVLPNLSRMTSFTPLLSLVGTLALVFVVGAVSLLWAVQSVARAPIVPALRGE